MKIKAAEAIDMVMSIGIIEGSRKPPKYGHAAVVLPPMLAKALWTWTSSKVKDKDVYTDESGRLGREKDHHITVKWGFTSAAVPSGMSKLCKETPPFVVHIGQVSLFKGDEYDVLKLSVSGAGLDRLHDAFGQFDNEDQRPEYSPHITLAYVKPGSCDHLVGDTVVPQEVSLVVVDKLRYKSGGGISWVKLKSAKG